ncbi:MAG: hypothetical protein WD876_02395 [Candidatus Pacearchaeota archaeon]
MKNEHIILWIVGVVVLLFLLGGYGMMGFGTSSYGFGGMMGMMDGSYGGGMIFFGWLYGLLILVALVLLIVWLSQQIQKK